MPITDQVSHYAMNTSTALAKQRGGIPDNIEEPGPEGDAARARVGQDAYDINVGQFCCGGLNFGSFIENSPIIAHDGAAPGYDIYNFTPSTVPGCRRSATARPRTGPPARSRRTASRRRR